MVMQVAIIGRPHFHQHRHLSKIPLLAKSYPIHGMASGISKPCRFARTTVRVEFMDPIMRAIRKSARGITGKLAPAFQYFADLQRNYFDRRQPIRWPPLKYYQWLVGGNGGIYRMVDETAILD